jgi:hypothetical protein
LYIIGAILFLIVYYPRRLQEPIGATVKKIYSLFSTNYTISFMVLLFFVCFFLSNFLCILVPIKIYKNAATERIKIQIENRGLSGIYLFKNLTTGEQYVGSSTDITNRFLKIF